MQDAKAMLTGLGITEPELCDYAAGKGLAEALGACPRGDWCVPLAVAAGASEGLLVDAVRTEVGRGVDHSQDPTVQQVYAALEDRSSEEVSVMAAQAADSLVSADSEAGAMVSDASVLTAIASLAEALSLGAGDLTDWPESGEIPIDSDPLLVALHRGALGELRLAVFHSICAATLRRLERASWEERADVADPQGFADEAARSAQRIRDLLKP